MAKSIEVIAAGSYIPGLILDGVSSLNLDVEFSFDDSGIIPRL